MIQKGKQKQEKWKSRPKLSGRPASIRNNSRQKIIDFAVAYARIILTTPASTFLCQNYSGVQANLLQHCSNAMNTQTSQQIGSSKGGQELQSFQQLQLAEPLLQSIYAYGFEKPSPIQRRALPLLAQGLDLVVQSQSGSGKTAACILGIMKRVDLQSPDLEFIILAPARELALEIKKTIEDMAIYAKIKVQAIVGGSSIREDEISLLNEAPKIIVGTPGRVLHQIKKGNINTKALKMVVLDQADELFSSTFAPRIIQISKTVPACTQLCFFSATYPPEIMELTSKFLKDPVRVRLHPGSAPGYSLRHFYIRVQEENHKMGALAALFRSLAIHRWMIFTDTHCRADRISQELLTLGIPTGVIHSETQDHSEALGEFRLGRTQVLVCTDAMARGIDICSVSVVVNYDMPDPGTASTLYMQRIGRCGRFGKPGVAISLVLPGEHGKIDQIRKLYGVDIGQLPTDPAQIAPWLSQ